MGSFNARDIVATLQLCTAALESPTVQDALRTLKNALDDFMEGDGHVLMIPVLTVAAAKAGSKAARPDQRSVCEDIQVSLLRSVYATDEFQNRTIH